jgi:hypothetical protein
MSARLLIIGLDGADGGTLDRASRDGTLPNIAALRARGQAWALSSALGATDDALWASFQYGVDVGEHGRYSYEIPTSSGQLVSAFTDELDRKTFWDELSRQDLRVAVLDVPKCRPPRALNGIHLADWLVHGRYFHSRPLAYPEALADDILTRFGAAPPSRCGYEYAALNDDEVLMARDNLLRAVGQKLAAGLHFLSAESWDLFIIGFKEAHCSCHMFWELADPEHAKYDAGRVARLGNPVLDVLMKQDAAIADLVAAAGPNANVVVFSTSDFTPNGTILHLMPKILERMNRYIGMPAGERMLYLMPKVLERVKRYFGVRGGERVLLALLRLCRRVAPPRVWSVLYSDNACALRVPRRPEDTAARYAQRLDLIAALARELVDVDDGLPVVSTVTRPAFEYAGKRVARLPHLLLHFRKNISSRAVISPRLGTIEALRPDNIRSGNHEAGGFAFAIGPAADVAVAQVKSMQDFASLAEKILVVRAQ